MNFGCNNNAERILSAIGRSQAIIEFDLTGRILTANQNFCTALGYTLTEIKGQHHRMFVAPEEVRSAEYAEFWQSLANGNFDQRQYKRIGKGGREIWIEASYNPVFKGRKPYKVIKIATDITARKLLSAEETGKLNALSRAQAVIEFKPTGEIITANANFLATLGYKLSEIQGQQHAIFCEPSYAKSPEYQRFWERLRAGEFVAEEFTRLGKGGRKVFIQASYNPIFDMNGKVFKVVKFATDVTGRVDNVEALADGLRRLASGDLTATIGKPFIPALDRLRADFNETVIKLQNAMRSVGDNARGIAAGSSQIRSAADDLSRRTEQQAASVEQTAAALEEITTTVSDSSKRAEEAGRLVAMTRDGAEKSGVIVQNAIAAMGDIASSSKEVSNIISVIDGIAFQTNLLALNAGVEAARAGDAGKGFAVVAQEVRELAQRSAQAAKEIKALITTSGQQVDTGVDLVGQAGQALEQIVLQVQEINRNVSAIVEAGREQAVGLREINLAVNTLDQGTQQNAAMVEETTAASHSLAREADALFALIGQFRVEERSSGKLLSTARRDPRPFSSVVKSSARSTLALAARSSPDNWEEF